MANERLWTKERITYFWNKIKNLVSTTASGKVDKVNGKGLSTNDYTNNDQTAVQTTLPNRITAIENAKGANGGYAELDSAGKVPSSQLPSFVDDVLEYASLGNFPLTGESGKIYVALDTNKAYRWSGSAYVEISPSLALGETSSTAYRGDRGKTAYDHAVAKGSAFTSGLYKITTNAQGHVTAATAVAKSDITGLGIPGSDTNTHRPIQVNGTEVLGNNTTALNLKAGSNVSVTNSSGTVTISATDTTYSSKTASSGGTDVSLVTTGEKYTWNNKASSDTKNTAGTSNKTGTKMFIAAATEQSANPQTYSNSNVYIGTDNCLYSGGTKVLTAHQDISGKKNTQSAVSDPSASGTSVTFISTISQNAQGVISPMKKTVRTMSGASSSAAGSTGLVPAPASGDQAKFLKGNGTWDVPEGSRLWTVDLDTVTVSTAGSYTHTTTVTNMSGSMKAAVIECGHPEIFLAPVVITTATNSVTLTCSSVAVGSSTVKVSFLMQGDNASPLSSGEYNALSGQIGTLANLNTDVKTNLVAAVNSVNSKIKIITCTIPSSITSNTLIYSDASLVDNYVILQIIIRHQGASGLVYISNYAETKQFYINNAGIMLQMISNSYSGDQAYVVLLKI